ncbi:Ras protein-specific guanine nucleotide-releasing factor [Phlyctochytrium bullatum]|nr:Ras protein-specific guanine nucleotide-releasing factor [Phlyctochytrium bullatum]
MDGLAHLGTSPKDEAVIKVPEELYPFVSEIDDAEDFDIVYESPASTIFGVSSSSSSSSSSFITSVSFSSVASSKSSIHEAAVDGFVTLPTRDGRSVKYATIRKLVDRLTHWRIKDEAFHATFMTTMCTFIGKKELWLLLSDRIVNEPVPAHLPSHLHSLYDQHVASPRRIAAMRVLAEWKAARPDEFAAVNEFSGFDEVLAKVLERAPNTPEAEREAIDRFLAAMESIKTNPTSSTNISSDIAPWENPQTSPVSLSPLQTRSSNGASTEALPDNPGITSLIGVDPLVLAKQMTMIDWAIYKHIKPHECLNQSYSQPGTRMVLAPEVVAIIERFNFVARLVPTLVMGRGTPQARADVLTDLVNVAKRCLEVYNFNSAHAITSALTSASIHRLGKTWEKVPKRTIAQLRELTHTFSPSHNWAELRALLAAVPPRSPAVPWMGLYLRDLVMVEEAQAVFLDSIHGSETEPMVNFLRCRNLARIIDEALRFQTRDPYRYRIVDGVRTVLLDEDGLLRSPTRQFELSLALEPRDGSGDVSGLTGLTPEWVNGLLDFSWFESYATPVKKG